MTILPFVGRWDVMFIQDDMTNTYKKNILCRIRGSTRHEQYISVVSPELKEAISTDRHCKYAFRLLVIGGFQVFEFVDFIIV